MSEFVMVKRELLERIAGLKPDYTCAQLDADEEELRAVLAQEAGRNQCGSCGAETVQACNDKGCHFFESGNGGPAQAAGPGERKPDAIIEGVMTSVGITHAIYASTVSLKHGEQVKLYAEPLPQHPILKVLNDPQAMELVALKATVAQQAQLIEWMKKGAPVVERQDRRDMAAEVHLMKRERQVPAAVALPERKPITPGFLDATNHGWNACLDKVKELNQ